VVTLGDPAFAACISTNPWRLLSHKPFSDSDVDLDVSNND